MSAGRGGDGCVSFRREKYVPRGGPDGGDGAPGGDVVLRATRQIRDLSTFRHRHHFRAPDGGRGSGGGRRGADGPDLVVDVPVGTEVRDADDVLVADLTREGARALVARGGEGGRGNTCFKSSRRQAPRFAERGLAGDERWLTLTLKLLADVGLVGLPNAGKSSLLAALTRARPKIAAYPFTTLEPNLGVLSADDAVMVLADIPGLVEGAGQGRGLGRRFLAHVERTSLLLYVVDASGGPDDAVQALDTVRHELASFEPSLAARPSLAAATKVDLLDADECRAVTTALAAVPWLRAVAAVSAHQGQGLPELRALLLDLFASCRRHEVGADDESMSAPPVLRPGGERLEAFRVEADRGAYRVHGVALERLVAKADLENDEAVAYLQDVMERVGLSDALRRAGARPGDVVRIGAAEFDFA